MRDFVNEKARLLQPSGIRKFFDIVRETEGAISLGVGEPDFVTPWSVRSAAIASLQRGYTQYTANRGMPALLELIARYLETRFSLSFDPAHILLTVGASEGIDLLLRACVERGDEILIPDPAYVSYAPCALMADGTPVAVKCREENGFVPTAEDLEAAVTEKSKILILTYPNNPTGGIADFSKAFAMTGWRLGYVCAPPAIDEAIFKIHQYSILCAPITAQYAAVEALKDGFSDDFAAVEEMRDSYDRRRRFVVDSLRGAGLSCFSPRGAFYAFPSVKNTSLSGEDFANLLLKEQKVAVVPGSAFGTFGRDNVRISYATGMTALTEACGRISEFMSKFR